MSSPRVGDEFQTEIPDLLIEKSVDGRPKDQDKSKKYLQRWQYDQLEDMEIDEYLRSFCRLNEVEEVSSPTSLLSSYLMTDTIVWSKGSTEIIWGRFQCLQGSGTPHSVAQETITLKEQKCRVYSRSEIWESNHKVWEKVFFIWGESIFYKSSRWLPHSIP